MQLARPGVLLYGRRVFATRDDVSVEGGGADSEGAPLDGLVHTLGPPPPVVLRGPGFLQLEQQRLGVGDEP